MMLTPDIAGAPQQARSTIITNKNDSRVVLLHHQITVSMIGRRGWHFEALIVLSSCEQVLWVHADAVATLFFAMAASQDSMPLIYFKRCWGTIDYLYTSYYMMAMTEQHA